MIGWNGGAKFSVVFLTFVKLLTPCGLTVCYINYSQSWELVRGRMWLAIKDLYTMLKSKLYSGSFSGQSSVSQGTGQGRILAPLCTRYILTHR